MPIAAFLTHGASLLPPKPIRKHIRNTSSFSSPHRSFPKEGRRSIPQLFNCSGTFRIRSFQPRVSRNVDASTSGNTTNGQDAPTDEVLGDWKTETSSPGSSFLAKLAIALGIAATITVISVGFKWPTLGPSLVDNASTSVGFSFKVFGQRVVLPEYAPGWIYFWLLMAAGCGLFISEEALNIWVGISLARMLSLDGTWTSFAESFSRNAPYIISTILWVYWGVCISDMVPFYLGKLFTKSGASDDICSKVGIGKEKALSITQVVQRYGNLIGFVERFSLGVRNPTSFLAGALGISSECFFAGVCFGGLITLPIQLGIGFLLREHPVVAIASVATAVGVWTVFPYAMAALTALFLFLRQRYFSQSGSDFVDQLWNPQQNMGN
ncbi:uncharacterized protein LOC122669757 [Telopea speciosissima]|uniref:uncharacterized protein LOC122669757 n=1 Tax=Telopea speciosissima TaxID=54955 RepID=UPI001CC349D3|nr:uncharacterized protein LOC122669757 [Telopea speciosissima]